MGECALQRSLNGFTSWWEWIRPHSPEAADLLAQLEAGAELSDVDTMRIAEAARQATGYPHLWPLLVDQLQAYGSGAAGHTSGLRDIPRRQYVHDLARSAVRLGRVRPDSRNKVARGVTEFGIDLDTLRTSMLVVAPPGSGKTTSIARPIVEHLALQALTNRASMIVLDPKGDDFDVPGLFDVTLDPLNPTVGFSLFGGAQTAEEAADRLASALLPADVSGDKAYFMDASRNAVYQCLEPYFQARGRWPTVSELLRLLRADRDFVGQVKGELKGPGAKNYRDLLDARLAQAANRSDPANSAVERFGLLDRPLMRRFLDEQPRQFSMLELNTPLRVRVALPESQLPDASRILARLIVSQFVQVASSPQTNRAIFKGMVFDEAGRFVDEYVARGVQKVRSNNAGLVLLTQSLGDFPEALLRTLMGSIGCKVVFGGIDTQDARIFSEYFGEQTVIDVRVSQSSGVSYRPDPDGGVSPSYSESQGVSVSSRERSRWTQSDLINGIPFGCGVVTLASADGRRVGPLLVDFRN